MKLYCVKIQVDDMVTDVQHMFGNDNMDIHKRMDEFLKDCKKYNLDENNYSFFEVTKVDGIDLNRRFGFDKYEIVNNKIKLNDDAFKKEYESTFSE